MEYYAHKDELLITHLKRTGELCKEFGSKFENEKVCEFMGLNHDLGKHTLKFLQVLNGERVKVDHAIVGAWIASGWGIKGIYEMTGYIIAAHHSLLNISEVNLNGPRDEYGNLDFNKDFYTYDNNKEMSVSSMNEFMEIVDFVKSNSLNLTLNSNDYFDLKNMSENQKMFYMRMLYSCLIDADYCATAENENPNYIKDSTGEFIPFEILEQQLETYRNNIIKNSNSNSNMNVLRNQIYEDCGKAGELGTNLYTLTAPTGTGKTLAILNFALKHCKENHKDRIIIVLPQLSIIDQNVKIYKEICGDNIVIEDDSNAEYDENTKLFSDRWSSQIIVTTSVKFFETLFKCKNTDLRRLHSICNSAVVFDEGHTLPSNLLNSTLEIMNELVLRYNTTVVFSSASPLNFNYRKGINWSPIEIIEDVDKLYKDYAFAKNLKIKFNLKPQNYSDLCKKITKNNACFIFNVKKQALHMYQELIKTYDEKDCYFISTSLCSQHRLDLIEEITKKLKNNEKCYVASTQCLEIGVDLDFIQVFKHLAPFPSVIQSAGRNDRNCYGNGEFEVFIIEDEELPMLKQNYPGTEYYNSAMKVKIMLDKHNGYLDINDLDILDEYSHLLYNTIGSDKDKEELIVAINDMNFEKTKQQYKMIDNGSVSVIVPYKNTINKYRKIRDEIDSNNSCITKKQMKQCRKFVVNCYDKNISKYCEQLKVRIHGIEYPTNWFIIGENSSFYDNNFGLNFEEISFIV